MLTRKSWRMCFNVNQQMSGCFVKKKFRHCRKTVPLEPCSKPVPLEPCSISLNSVSWGRREIKDLQEKAKQVASWERNTSFMIVLIACCYCYKTQHAKEGMYLSYRFRSWSIIEGYQDSKNLEAGGKSYKECCLLVHSLACSGSYLASFLM